jgi:hypothetical protein
MAKAASRSRSPQEIAAELSRERQGLADAFAVLRAEAADASHATNPTIAFGRKAALFVPALATAATATVAGVVSGLRSRAGKEQGSAGRQRRD